MDKRDNSLCRSGVASHSISSTRIRLHWSSLLHYSTNIHHLHHHHHRRRRSSINNLRLKFHTILASFHFGREQEFHALIVGMCEAVRVGRVTLPFHKKKTINNSRRTRGWLRHLTTVCCLLERTHLLCNLTIELNAQWSHVERSVLYLWSDDDDHAFAWPARACWRVIQLNEKIWLRSCSGVRTACSHISQRQTVEQHLCPAVDGRINLFDFDSSNGWMAIVVAQ